MSSAPGRGTDLALVRCGLDTADLLARALGPQGRRAVAALQLLLVGGLFAWALPGVVDYLRFLRRERTPVLQWRLNFVYACFGIFVTAVVVGSAWQLMALARSGWRDQVKL